MVLTAGVLWAQGNGRWTHGGLPQRDPRFVVEHTSDLLGHPVLQPLRSDGRLLALVERLLGGPARLGGSDGHVFFGDTGWCGPHLSPFATPGVHHRLINRGRGCAGTRTPAGTRTTGCSRRRMCTSGWRCTWTRCSWRLGGSLS